MVLKQSLQEEAGEKVPHGSSLQDCLSPFVSGGITRSSVVLRVRSQLSTAYVAHVEMCKVVVVEPFPIVSSHRSSARYFQRTRLLAPPLGQPGIRYLLMGSNKEDTHRKDSCKKYLICI